MDVIKERGCANVYKVTLYLTFWEKLKLLFFGKKSIGAEVDFNETKSKDFNKTYINIRIK